MRWRVEHPRTGFDEHVAARQEDGGAVRHIVSSQWEWWRRAPGVCVGIVETVVGRAAEPDYRPIRPQHTRANLVRTSVDEIGRGVRASCPCASRRIVELCQREALAEALIRIHGDDFSIGE